MSIIVDRRKNSKGKSSSNRRRFLKRVEDQIKDAIPDIVDSNKIKDLSGGTERINIPIDGVAEPNFNYNGSARDDMVLPGNDEFVEGDLISKPPTGKGKGSGKGAGDEDGDAEDDFVVNISRDEFIDYFFKDLELPDVVKKSLEKTPDYEYRRAGYTNEGVPSKLNIEESYKNALGRNVAMKGVYDAMIKELEEKREKTSNVDRIKEIDKKIEELKVLRDTIPFIDEFDLRYNNHKKYPLPATSCVMFCIMDVSGSMGKKEKDIAKRFFMLLYIFLTREYENIELVFIRHTTVAKEVDEEEFFTSRKTGGTKILPALELARNIIDNRYKRDNRNFYVAQVGDGGVWGDSDGKPSAKFVKDELLPVVQFMCYLEIDEIDIDSIYDSKALSEYYENINSDKFNQKIVSRVSEIWPIFKEFFKKE